jgi:hypothetical protein
MKIFKSVIVSLVLFLFFLIPVNAEIAFKNDKAFFTLWAYINYTGYDHNNGINNYHPIRKDVRNYLDNKNYVLSDNGTGWSDLSSHGSMEGDYTFTLVQMNGYLPYLANGPDHIWNKYVHPELENLYLSLNEFYTTFDINQLWLDQQSAYNDLLTEYRDESQFYIDKTLNHFNITVDNYPDFWIIPNPLSAYWFGLCVSPNDRLSETKPVYLSIGLNPDGSPNIGNIIHEMVHVFEGPAVESYKDLDNLISLMFQNHPDALSKSGYSSMEKIINESFARGITAWSQDNVSQADREVSDGFVISRFIYDRVNDFDDHNTGFEGWVHNILDEYKNSLNGGLGGYTQEDIDNAFNDGKQACINDPLSCGIGGLLLFHKSLNPKIRSGANITIYGTSDTNSVTLNEGSKVTLVNFPGYNSVTIESESSLFHVNRSGTMVNFEGSNGTVLKIPATNNIQTISFNDKTLTLGIVGSDVMLDGQIITAKLENIQ